MKRYTSYLISPLVKIGLLFAVCLLPALSHAAGLLVPVNTQTPLAIQSHDVNVVVEDGYAVTQVEQVFSNSGDSDLEAIYSFPVPHDAAVGEFVYWIDGQPIQGEVVAKEKAQQVYQQEKQAGRETALVEKDKYKTFDIKVFPVRANQSVKIRLVYLQPVFVDAGIGRYVYPLEEGDVDEQKLAFWGQADEVKKSFTFDIDFRSRYPIEDVRFASHPRARIEKISAQQWRGSLHYGELNSEEKEKISENDNKEYVAENSSLETARKEKKNLANSTELMRLNKDVVVYWRHQAGLPGSVDMVSYKEGDNKKGTFALTITPGAELAQLQQGRDWVFVLDTSGSMSGKIATLAEGVVLAINKMSAQDRVRIVTFNNASFDTSGGYINADAQGKKRLEKTVRNMVANGGTNLFAGLQLGLQKLDADRTASIILVTDGVANVGYTEKKYFYRLLDDADVRLFTFVMGNSANKPLLEGMSKHSNGFSQNISNADDIVGQMLWAMEKVTHESLRDITVSIDGVRVADVTPKAIGTLYRGQQLMVFGHYWGGGNAKVTVSGKIAGQTKSWNSQVLFPQQNIANPELERLWGFAAIKGLAMKMDKLGDNIKVRTDSEKAIESIAMEYGLVTDYTSMIVLREEQYAQYGIDRNNKKRVEKEQAARAQRDANAPVAYVPAQKKSSSGWSKPRPSLGGGSMGFYLFLLLPLLTVRKSLVKK